MPWAWAMLHMMAGVTAPPRWQWSSASGTFRESWRAIAVRIRAEAQSGDPALRRVAAASCRSQWTLSLPADIPDTNEHAHRAQIRRRPDLSRGRLLVGRIRVRWWRH